MQKLHNSKTPKVYKNKKLNNANFGTYNLNDYQAFLQIISKIGKVDLNGTYQQPQDLKREYTLTAKEFSQAFGVDINTSYGVLKRASNKLARTAITLEKPELSEIWDIPICETSKYNTTDGGITVVFNTHIMPYLTQVKSKFVLYNLKEIANFGSLYTTRLYELIQEFKDTGYIIKSVAQLREVFAVGKKFKLYADFKNRTFGHAVTEINSQYEMNLRFEELKDGRKVVAIRFEFTPSRTSQGYSPATKSMVSVTVKPRRKTELTPEELAKKEARRAKEKEYRDRHELNTAESAGKQDDDNTPPPVPVPAPQPELTLMETASSGQKSKNKLLLRKGFEGLGIKEQPEVKKKFDELDEDAGILKQGVAWVAGGKDSDVRRFKKVIEVLMRKKNLSREDATIYALELDLI